MIIIIFMMAYFNFYDVGNRTYWPSLLHFPRC